MHQVQWEILLGIGGLVFSVIFMHWNSSNRFDAMGQRIDAHIAATRSELQAMGDRIDAMGQRIDGVHQEIMGIIKLLSNNKPEKQEKTVKK